MHFKDKNGHSIRMQSKATGVDWGKKTLCQWELSDYVCRSQLTLH